MTTINTEEDTVFGAIMNLPCVVPTTLVEEVTREHFLLPADPVIRAYRIAHRDARHAAAELVAASSASKQERGTPAAQWRANGEPDPHGKRYDCERAALCMGDLSDDELANGAFLNYDNFDVQKLIAATPGYHPPIAWMTAVKDRIRWLSRRLEEASAALKDRA